MTISEQSDENLYAAYHECADMAAFEALYARYRQPLYLFLLRRGHTPMSAEDLFHNCWLRVIDSERRFDGKHFRGWIYTVARHLSSDDFRRSDNQAMQSVDDAQLPTSPSSERVRHAEDCIDLIRMSVVALPMDQRDAFLLREEAGLSLQQIADVMAVGRETIKSRLRYAMKQLRQWMEDCL